MKNILVLATGGTIAAVGKDAADTTHYRYGELGPQHLLKSSPSLARLADITSEDLFRIGSEDMTFAHWLKLANSVQEKLEQYDGIVITHGTDTMEETAFFLDLLLQPKKPVVITGAMLPATAENPDGPGNLLDALRVAVDGNSAGRGVLCVLGGVVWAAEGMRKFDVGSLQAYSAGDKEPAAKVIGEHVEWAAAATVPRGHALGFKIPGSLPEVGLIYGCSGMSVPSVTMPCVAAGFGLGTLPQHLREALLASGQLVVIAGQTEKGRIVQVYPEFMAVNLPPRQARVLLICALAQGLTTEELQQILQLYA